MLVYIHPPPFISIHSLGLSISIGIQPLVAAMFYCKGTAVSAIFPVGIHAWFGKTVNYYYRVVQMEIITKLWDLPLPSLINYCNKELISCFVK